MLFQLSPTRINAVKKWATYFRVKPIYGHETLHGYVLRVVTTVCRKASVNQLALIAGVNFRTVSGFIVACGETKLSIDKVKRLDYVKQKRRQNALSHLPNCINKTDRMEVAIALQRGDSYDWICEQFGITQDTAIIIRTELFKTRPSTLERKCLICETPFIPRIHKAWHCSIKCGQQTVSFRKRLLRAASSRALKV